MIEKRSKSYLEKIKHYDIGEYLISSIDDDGCMKGFDIELVKLIKKFDAIEKGVNFTKHNTEQGADGSKGCLEIDFTVTKDEQVYIHNTGIWIKAVKRVPGSKEKPARAKVTMMVKSLDKEPGYLHVTRLWGAGSTTVFKLTPEWQKVETVITSPYPVGDLLLVPVNKKHRIVSGKVLVDNVEVKAAEEK